MSRTKVSILIPVHDGEGYVGKAIRSILGQSFRELEVIVLDDGSQDGSARVARSFGDSRVRVYRRENHEGVATTRNHMLMVAHSPLVAFLDADDVALVDRIARQVAFLDRHRDFGLVACSWFQIDTQGQTLRRRALPQDHEGITRRMLHGSALPASTVMVRREAIDAAGGFDSSLGLAAEYDLFLKVSEKARVGALSEPLVKCRVHSKAASYERRHEVRESVNEALRRAVRRRYRKPLALAIRAEQAQPFLFEPSGEPARAVPSDLAQDVNGAEALPTGLTTGTVPEVVAESTSQPSGERAEMVAAEEAGPGVVETNTGEALPLATPTGVTNEESVVAVAATDQASEASAAPRQMVLGEITAEGALTADCVAAPTTDSVEAVTSTTPDAAVGAMAEVAEAAEATDGAEESAESEPAPVIEVLVAAAAPVTPPKPEAATDREAMVAVVIEATSSKALSAVRSVLDQSVMDLVVAVVSTRRDEGLERGLELLGDDRVLLLECDGGNRARAFNLGILATRSRYIAYLADNSIYRTEHLDRLTQAAETDRLGLVYADVGLATAGVAGTVVSGRDFDGELLLKENFIPTEAVLHRRDLLDEVGLFNEGLDEGMEWEMWVYLSRVAAARRIPSPSVERLVGGPNAAKLIAPSPSRVRRHLAEKFKKTSSLDSTPEPIVHSEETGVDGDGVARAQDRIRRGDWAGAAVEIVDAASRQLTALSQLFSPRYPERELPQSELPARVLASEARLPVARPRTHAEVTGAEATEDEHESVRAERNMPSDILPHRLQAAAGAVSAGAAAAMSSGSGWTLGREPEHSSYAPTATLGLAMTDAQTENARASAEPGPSPTTDEPASKRTGGWVYLNGHMVPRHRPSSPGAVNPRSAQPRATGLGRPTAHGPLQGKRKKAIEAAIEHPNCPMCGSGGTILEYRAGWFRVLECRTCDMGFSVPRLEPSRAGRFFSERNPEIVPPHIRTASDCLETRYDRSREIGWARRHVREGRLVDVGCSWGYGMAQAAQLGFDAFGTELSRVLARTARERFGLEVKERDFPDLGLEDGELSVVMAIHVIHHFAEPTRFFNEAMRTLRSGGVLVGTIPNFDAFLRSELGRRWKWLDPECQPYHYRPSSLMAALRGAGFDAEVWTSEGLYGEAALLEIVKPEEAAELARSGRGSEIGFIARKR